MDWHRYRREDGEEWRVQDTRKRDDRRKGFVGKWDLWCRKPECGDKCRPRFYLCCGEELWEQEKRREREKGWREEFSGVSYDQVREFEDRCKMCFEFHEGSCNGEFEMCQYIGCTNRERKHPEKGCHALTKQCDMPECMGQRGHTRWAHGKEELACLSKVERATMLREAFEDRYFWMSWREKKKMREADMGGASKKPRFH